MNIYEDENVVVKPSPIEGRGVFAKRPFKTGETVLRWKVKRLSPQEETNIDEGSKRYVNTLEDGTKVLMQIPERYVNSSTEPNTATAGEADVAIRDIEVGEEITSEYPIDSR